MSESYYLRELTVDDWKSFYELEKLVFPDEAMNEASFKRGLSGFKTSTIAAIDKESKKFVGYYRIATYGKEGHIYRIGVHPEYRQKGIGAVLLEKSMAHLKNAGCSNYYLYVKEDNYPAINLYKKFGFKIETKSWQFKIPYKTLPSNPQGKCRHIDWGEIQLVSLRFRLNPLLIQHYFGYENEHILVYEHMGQQIGFGRFSPSFPGAMPFIIKDVNYSLDMVAQFKPLITDPDYDHIKVTFDNQEQLVEHLKKKNIPLNYELLKMRKLTEDEM